MQHFVDQFPNYLSSQSDEFYFDKLPDSFFSGICGILYSSLDDSHVGLKRIVNILLSYIPEQPTSNWGDSYLQEDLKHALLQLKSKRLEKMADAIMAITIEINSRSFMNMLNDYFIDIKFGYRIEYGSNEYYWIIIDEKANRTPAIVAAVIPDLKTISAQSCQHLEQLLSNLKNNTLRADKDAIRDAMSAMESLLKQVSGESDIKDATAKLKLDPNKWGISDIVKDGLSIWNKLHELYPDVRHGNPSVNEIDKETVYYWIERIMVFIQYITRKI